ncbi:hypothetical protein ACFPK1_08610 [Actinomycetospora rhizophila]|uniref:Uncharacterized protein n=1 Tax=Actinomycetospora rhizophila TaxID=1416876 RepID=A0ABV9ZA83_9PSEU
MTTHVDRSRSGSGTTAPRDEVHEEGGQRSAQEPVGTGLHWGAVWAGALVALPVFLVLELLFVGFGWLDLGTQQSAASSIVSAVLALVAFLVGGVLAGRVAGPERRDGGVLHGVLVWALTTAGLVALGVVGGSALAGDVGTMLAGAGSAPPPSTGSLAQSTTDASGWGALWLGVSVVAAALGGIGGARTHR